MTIDNVPNAPSRLSRATGLRRFAVPPPAPDSSPGAGAAGDPAAGSGAGDAAREKCELCGERLGPEHSHLVDLRQRSLGCACRACALLFTRPGQRYRTVPDRVRIDAEAPLTAAEWAELAIPVGIAFFFVNSDLGRVVASYPSPAGVTECELDLTAWDRLAETHPLLRAPEEDVEAILVYGTTGPDTAGQDIETFLVPVDVCYSLAGAMRLHWHGFDGGPEVKRVLADLRADLSRRARPLAPAPGGT
jgi:hypothetical protein